ncbi:MAG: DUF423 domain-containing protein, partial [Ignavibacteriales bacterium]
RASRAAQRLEDGGVQVRGGEMGRPWLVLAALNGLMAVGFGAYAAHGLAGHAVNLADRASQYQMAHALALLAVDRLAADRPAARWAGGLFVLGIVLFCGSLYLKAVTGGPLALPLPLVTPAGGLCLMAGWATLAVSGIKA